MSLKWTGGQSESGILRKSEFKEKKEDLFVFGYSCKLFRDDDKALHIDQGKHLIPWMGDETLKIDRYDARGALHDLTRLEAPPGGYDWRVELTRGELDVEQLCDEERYRALHTDEDEEEMYKEEELKRLHAAGYGQVGFNYDAPAEPEPPPQPAEVDEEPFIPTPAFRALLPIDTVFPETLKQNAIIEKTAKFIASQGAQMEILIKAKQGDNAQFKFLNRDSQLNPYYTALIGLVKAGKWPEKKVEVVEEKPPENEDYLHPSLASTVIESAPAIPSIHYKPSADCDYTMLISKMRGEGEGGSDEEARGDVPPPGTEPPAQRPPTAEIYRAPVMYTRGPDGNHVDPTAPPVNPAHYQQYATYYHQYLAQEQQKQIKKEPPPTLKSTGLSLMKNYNTDSDSEMSDYDDSSSTDSRGKTSIITPPEDVQIVIDKMASYVARNGDEFADIVRSKNDPRFTFLEPENIYHAYYKRLMQQKRGIDVNGKEKKRKTSAPVSFSIKKLKEPDPILPKPALPYESSSDDDSEKPSDKQEERREKEEFRELPKVAPQMFPINNIPPVVVYKIDGQLHNDLPLVKTIEAKPVAKITPQPVIIPVIKETPKKEEILVLPETTVNKPVVEEVKNTIVDNNVKKIETERDSPQKQEGPSTRDSPHMRESPNSRDSPYNRDSPFVKDSPHKRDSPPKRNSPHKRDSPHRRDSTQKRDSPHRRDSPHMRDSSYRRESPHKRDNPPKRDSPYRRESPHRRDSPYIRETHKRDKKKTRDRKREHRSKSESRESRRIERTSADGEKKREKDKIKDNERERKKIKLSKDDLENEIISLEDNSDDLIDLTGDQSDSKGEGETEAERAKQQERRRRAAEFLKKVGVDPSAAALPTSSLASAMVDTLESIRKKKAEEEEKRRRRDKRRHRDRRDYEDESERSHRKSKRRKYKSSEDNDESDYDGSKKKKRKKDRKHSSKNKRKRRRELDADEEQPPPINIDLTNTLKELRTCSPTKDLVLQDLDDTQHSFARQESSDEEVIRDKRRKKESRQYSEGEWSSDSEGDSKSTTSKKDE